MEYRSSRWRRAQKAEWSAWDRTAVSKVLTDKIRRENLAFLSKYSGFDENQLNRLRILEIGGPVVERAFAGPPVTGKYVVDPLFPWPHLASEHANVTERIRGMAENLGMSDKSIDLCLCANVIDHTAQPGVALREIRRVLVDDGLAIISCDLISGWAKPLIPVFNILDAPHPHHFTLAMFRKMLEEHFDILEQIIDSIYAFSLKNRFKMNIGAVFGMKYVFFICKPKLFRAGKIKP